VKNPCGVRHAPCLRLCALAKFAEAFSLLSVDEGFLADKEVDVG